VILFPFARDAHCENYTRTILLELFSRSYVNITGRISHSGSLFMHGLSSWKWKGACARKGVPVIPA
jgi:hypothetical protein